MRARSGTLSSGLWYVTTAFSLSLSFRESTITLEPSFPTQFVFEKKKKIFVVRDNGVFVVLELPRVHDHSGAVIPYTFAFRRNFFRGKKRKLYPPPQTTPPTTNTAPCIPGSLPRERGISDILKKIKIKKDLISLSHGCRFSSLRHHNTYLVHFTIKLPHTTTCPQAIAARKILSIFFFGELATKTVF
jgi:hypothetical protein